MTTVQEALRTAIIADPTISALIGSRLYAGNLPSNPTYPLIRQFDVSIKRDAFNTTECVRTQYSVFDRSQTNARRIATALRSFLDRGYGVYSGVKIRSIRHMITNDLIVEDDTGLFETAADFRVCYALI